MSFAEQLANTRVDSRFTSQKRLTPSEDQVTTVKVRHFSRLKQLRFDFDRVPKVDIVIVFSGDPEEFPNYFPGLTVLLVDIDAGQRKFFPFFGSILKRNLRLAGYLAEVVNKAGAQLVISNQDNLLELFRVKPLLRKAELVLIQNGTRSLRTDLADVVASSRDNLSVSSYLGFNEAQGSWMRELFRGDYLAIGSFRSNHVARVGSPQNLISYISTFNPEVSKHHKVVSRDGRAVTYGDILDYRLNTLRIIQNLSADVGCALRILGKRIGTDANAEYGFYRENLGSDSFEFISKRDRYANYSLCDESRLVVSTSSTLGLESLGRGNRTLLLNEDASRLGDTSLNFGWPESLPQSGPFWLSSITKKEVIQRFSDLWTREENEWKHDLAPYQRFLPKHDPGNSLFCEKLRHFGAQSPLRPSSDT
jgi:surface carbohydrate biosynthesis protein